MRLIDADAFIEKMHELYGHCELYIRAIRAMIEAAPTIDSVKHGRWIAMSDADGVYWACSECGEDLPRISHYNPQFDLFPRLESIDRTNYCPNCGADMRERKEE